LLHLADEAQSSPRDRANELLPVAAVADGAARGVDAIAQGRLRDDPPLTRPQQIVLADDMIAVLDQVSRSNTRLDMGGLAAAGRFASGRIERNRRRRCIRQLRYAVIPRVAVAAF
jgi:hypothetical protein